MVSWKFSPNVPTKNTSTMTVSRSGRLRTYLMPSSTWPGPRPARGDGASSSARRRVSA